MISHARTRLPVRLMALFAALLVLGMSYTARPAAAAPSGSGAVRYATERQHYLSPVDGQGCWDCATPWYVVNPTVTADWYYGEPACAWNDQDDMLRVGSGYVDPSAPSTDRLCLISDLTSAPGITNRPHSIYVNVYAPQNTLQVGLANDVGDRWTAGPPVPSGSGWLWRLCVRDPVADRAGITSTAGLGFWPVIPDSNGGRGQRVEYSLTLASPGRRTRSVSASFEIAGTGSVAAAPRAITNCG